MKRLLPLWAVTTLGFLLVCATVQSQDVRPDPSSSSKITLRLASIANALAHPDEFEKNRRKSRLQSEGLEAARPEQYAIVGPGNQIYVMIYVAGGYRASAVVTAIDATGAKADVWDDRFGMIQAWVRPEVLNSLAELVSIRMIEPILPPDRHVGAVNSEGDSRMRADVSRTLFNATGAGVKVGVMSDDCGQAEGLLATRIGNGELGAGTTVIDDGLANPAPPAPARRTHEGLAMMEIVQDVAPQAQILFATASKGPLSFAQNINALVSNGCKAITDDIGYLNEPVFEDGPISQAVNDAATNNVLYTSAAGNDALVSYYSTYVNLPNQVIGNQAGANKDVHNFGGGVILQTVTLPPNATVTVTLQWDDPFLQSGGGGGSRNNFDLYIVNNAGTATIDSSINIQSDASPGNPFESVSIVNPNAVSITSKILVRRVSVSATDPNGTPRIKILAAGGSALQFGGALSSIYGHPGARGCVASGAISATANNYNTIYRQFEEYDHALLHLRKGIELARGMGSKEAEASLLYNIGNTLHSGRRFNEALPILIESLELAREQGDQQLEEYCLENIGNCYHGLEEFASADVYFRLALDLTEHIGDRPGSISCRTNLGLLQIDLGEFEGALSELTRAMDEATELHDRPLLRGAHNALYRLHEERGEPGDVAQAFHHYKEYTQLHEELLGAERQREIDALRLRAEVERGEQERELIRLEQRKMQLEMEHQLEDLNDLAARLAEKNRLIMMLKDELARAAIESPPGVVDEALQKIEQMHRSEQDWRAFDEQLNQVHQGFLAGLARRAPALTPAELKVCALLRTHISTREIADLLAVSDRAIEKLRYQIRKKLAITSSTNLTEFLEGL
jgi:tetratricopeptide (TPR) repeat protein/DNA-binding CsgD family transcriptional regulator